MKQKYIMINDADHTFFNKNNNCKISYAYNYKIILIGEKKTEEIFPAKD